MVERPQELRLLIVSSEPLIRAGLSALLEDEPGIVISGQSSPGTDVEAFLPIIRPEMILWDLGWEASPGDQVDLQNELDQISDLASEGIAIMVLISSPEFARDTWVAGARAILQRDVDRQSLLSAIFSSANNLVVLDDSISAHLLPELGLPERALEEELTPRESQVLQQLAEGLPNKVIALNLGVSEHTIKFHINSIFRKLGVRSRTEAVVRGTQLGLIVL